jgi:hypothetical protein
MTRVLRNPVAVVWLVLVLATGVSWWTGLHERSDKGPDIALASVLLLLIAFLKVRFVLLYFMELRRSPLQLRLLFEAWTVIAFGALAAMFWFGLH